MAGADVMVNAFSHGRFTCMSIGTHLTNFQQNPLRIHRARQLRHAGAGEPALQVERVLGQTRYLSKM